MIWNNLSSKIWDLRITILTLASYHSFSVQSSYPTCAQPPFCLLSSSGLDFIALVWTSSKPVQQSCLVYVTFCPLLELSGQSWPWENPDVTLLSFAPRINDFFFFFCKYSGNWVFFFFLLPIPHRYLVNLLCSSNCFTHIGAVPIVFSSQDPTSTPILCRVPAAYFSKEIDQGHPIWVPSTFIFHLFGLQSSVFTVVSASIPCFKQLGKVFSFPVLIYLLLPIIKYLPLFWDPDLSLHPSFFCNLNFIASYHVRTLRSFWSFRVGFLSDWPLILWATLTFCAGWFFVVGVSPVYCKMFSSNFGHYSPDSQ